MKKIFTTMTILAVGIALAGCSTTTSRSSWFSGWGSSRSASAAEKQTEGGLVGTTVDPSTGKAMAVNVNMTGGGDIGMRSMDAADQKKMARALDGGLGKPTTWDNPATGIKYTVTPIKKLTINGNPFCREYQTMMARGSNQKSASGTACITTDGTWHTVRG